VIVDAVLHIGRGVRLGVEPLIVGLVLGEEKGGVAVAAEAPLAQLLFDDIDDAEVRPVGNLAETWPDRGAAP
jgi:hypothetical protein